MYFSAIQKQTLWTIGQNNCRMEGKNGQGFWPF